MNIETSKINWGVGDITMKQCLDCGAYVLEDKTIIHYDSCVPGDAKHWEEYYEQNHIQEQIEEKEIGKS